MTQQELVFLLEDAESVQRQLNTLVTQLQLAVGRGGQEGAQPVAQGRPAVRAQQAQHDRNRPPSDGLLLQPCPKCGRELNWRWSRQNESWFAGCVGFTSDGCRGSRSYGALTATAQAPGLTASLPPIEDIERIEKHHGAEGPLTPGWRDDDDGKIPF